MFKWRIKSQSGIIISIIYSMFSKKKTFKIPVVLLAFFLHPACQGFADIVIAIDDSSSTQRDDGSGGTEVAPGQFDLARYYIQNSLLNTANINIGIVAHSNTARVLAGFSDNSVCYFKNIEENEEVLHRTGVLLQGVFFCVGLYPMISHDCWIVNTCLNGCFNGEFSREIEVHHSASRVIAAVAATFG